MDPKEAQRIARHHLGEHLRDVIPVGSGYNVLIHLGGGGYRSAFASEAEDLPAVCQGAAAQLRAAGWTPTHERLEWTHGCLYLHTGSTKFIVATTIGYAGGWAALIQPGCHDWYRCTEQADAVAHVVEWCKKHLPNYHLPPFPGDKP